MFKQILLIAVLFFLFTVIADNLNAVDLEITSTAEIMPGSVQASQLSISSADAKSSVTDGTVNLYSGQHVESFPLASVAGRGNLGFTLTLDYNGNVSYAAREENRKVQASPFGLGFDLGLQSIVVEHGNTASLYDDDYYMVSANNTIKLINVEGNRFITEQGNPWIITRNTATIDSCVCIIGWSIIKEDGMIYQFGDHSSNTQEWNATRNILLKVKILPCGCPMAFPRNVSFAISCLVIIPMLLCGMRLMQVHTRSMFSIVRVSGEITFWQTVSKKTATPVKRLPPRLIS